MRLGIVGGTFNPVHKGHISIAVQAKKSLALDKVLFMPAYIQPHRQQEEVACSEDRCNMLKLVLKDMQGFEVSQLEIGRGGVSYTVDTLRELRKECDGSDELFFIIGSDNIKEFFSWKEPDEILELAKVVVVQRGGYNALSNEDPRFLMVDINPVDISACRVRRKIRNGESIDELVEPAVIEYIKERGLYK